MPRGIYIRKPMSEKTKKRISNSLKGKIPKNLDSLRNLWRGQHHSKTTKIKMRNAKIGKRGENVANWKGGRRIRGKYISIFSSDHPHRSGMYVYEHRLVVEEQIGRFLNNNEKVHHLGAKTDNRIGMLMVFISQSAHLRFERGGVVKPEEIIFDGRNLKY